MSLSLSLFVVCKLSSDLELNLRGFITKKPFALPDHRSWTRDLRVRSRIISGEQCSWETSKTATWIGISIPPLGYEQTAGPLGPPPFCGLSSEADGNDPWVWGYKLRYGIEHYLPQWLETAPLKEIKLHWSDYGSWRNPKDQFSSNDCCYNLQKPDGRGWKLLVFSQTGDCWQVVAKLLQNLQYQIIANLWLQN